MSQRHPLARRRLQAAALGPSSPSADVAIVLGASAWGTEPSPALAERLAAAAALYQAGNVRHLILTGGVDTGGTTTAAVVTHGYHLHRAVLLDRGVSPMAVLAPDLSAAAALAWLLLHLPALPKKES